MGVLVLPAKLTERVIHGDAVEALAGQGTGDESRLREVGEDVQKDLIGKQLPDGQGLRASGTLEENENMLIWS